MEYNCELVIQANQPVISIRTRASVEKLPQVLGESYNKLMQYVQELGADFSGAPFAAYYNMDMQDLDIEIGFPVNETLPGKGDIQSSEIPAGNYASCIHVGPYNEIGPAYTALLKWLQEKNLTSTGVAYEFYLNDPSETPPHELRTQIKYQIAST